MRSFSIAVVTVLIAGVTTVLAQSTSPNGVKTLKPEGAIKTTGTWDLGTRAGDFVFVAGMRGIDPKTNTLVQGDEFRFRPIVNKVQEELWGQPPYPPRTIVEIHRLNQDDIMEVEGTFYAPAKK